MKSLPFHILEPWERYPFRPGEAFPYRPLKGVPRGRLDFLKVFFRFLLARWSSWKRTFPSSKTQGQIKGARESLNGRTNIHGMKKSKERREDPLGTMSYQTSSNRSPPFWLLIGARKLVFFWHQSEGRTAATVWNWSGKTLSPGAFLVVLYFSSCHIFPPV